MAGRRHAHVPAVPAVLVRRLPGALAPRCDERVPRPRGPLRARSAVDRYPVGIGPSSSHTVGPMRAARRFVSSRPVTHTHKVSLTEAGRPMAAPAGPGHEEHIHRDRPRRPRRQRNRVLTP
ncbi:serine dehydratase beta chain [Streptomyces lydicus]|uniref:serine dehydratase beta chain n=1 Tax=Streptomyces lydicus TaxID=47763 RepID=UPI003F4DE098